jgi:hypothetical protein
MTLFTVLGACVLSMGHSPWTLGFAAFVGMVNGMGRDRGAALVLEQAVLPATTTDADRTMAFRELQRAQDVGPRLRIVAGRACPWPSSVTLDASPMARSEPRSGARPALRDPLFAYARPGSFRSSRDRPSCGPGNCIPSSRASSRSLSGLFASTALAGDS